MSSVMLDIETFGITTNTVITTFGAVKFDQYSTDEPHTPVYWRLNIEEQLERGRTIADSTLEWWAKQTPEEQEEAFGSDGRIPVIEFLHNLNRYLVGYDKIFSQGAVFDIAILENLYAMYDTPVPWHYYTIRDSRTVGDFGDKSDKTTNVKAHNALADAYAQAITVQKIYSKCGVTDPRKI